jgi:hypothetical protein
MLIHIVILLTLCVVHPAYSQSTYWQTRGSAATTEPYTAIEVGPSGTVYLGLAGPGIFMSTDQGSSWTKDWEMPGWWAYTQAFYAPSHDTVYAATYQGFYRSIDNGAHWALMNEGLTSTGLVDLAVSSEYIYVVSQKGVVSRTRDGGDSWIRVDSLPIVQAYEIEIGARHEIWVSTRERGVYLSQDSGSSWTQLYDGSTVGLLKLGPDSNLYLARDDKFYRLDHRDLSATDLDFSGPLSDVEFDSRGTLFASSTSSPGIRKLDAQGKWVDHFSQNFSLVSDIAISKDDIIYAMTWGSVYRSWQPTTSGVRTHSNDTTNCVCAEGEYSIEVIDVLGKTAFSRTYRHSALDVQSELGYLHPGAYLVVHKCDEGLRRTKIVIAE